MSWSLYDEEAASPFGSSVYSSRVSRSDLSISSEETISDEKHRLFSFRRPERAHLSTNRPTSTACTALPVNTIANIKHEAAQALALPKKTGSRIHRFVRWNFFSTYRRLFTIVFLVNLAIIIAMATTSSRVGPISYTQTSNAAAVNLAIALVMRHEHMVNLLFKVSASLPLTAPLWLRKLFAKIYSYGGIHSGCGLAAVVWYLIFTGVVLRHTTVEPFVQPSILVLTFVTLSLLILIVIFSHPTLRNKFHNSFEATHRFAGWSVLALFWSQVILLTQSTHEQEHRSFFAALMRSTAFWCLVISTACVAYPWVRLRRRKVEVQHCSSHAMIVRFSHSKPSWGSALRVSDNSLKENHAFAVIPEPNGQEGFSIVISHAGDWTKKMIQNPPTNFWVKGTPALGVIRVASMFTPVLIVATGSGIGPCLSFFRGCPGHPCRVLWSTPSPLETYGHKLIEDVYKADSEAIIIDSRKTGRPNLVEMSYRLFMESKCEAVVVISNQKVTKKLVYGLETRGVPAYGPIFDS